MARVIVILLTTLLAAPALADRNDPWCQNLWLSRNTVMDRAGQCFASPLGQAVFDNSDCVPGERPLSPLDAEIVSRLSAMEAEFDCAVNTDAQALDPRSARWRAQLAELWTVPIRADTEHSCMGYTGPEVPLYAGMSTSTTVIGVLRPGHNFSFSHDPMPPDWEYIQVSDEDHTRVGHGWVRGIEMNEEVCTWGAG